MTHGDGPNEDAANEAFVALLLGAVINDRYRVDRLMGQGGVGIVFAAQNLELDERVALKFLKPSMIQQKDVVARFAHEAKAACSIRGEYVCSVHDVGTFDGAPFLVMEHLDGQNLEALLRTSGALQPRAAVEYVMQACEALSVAHAKGIVHRDIKPENLFLTERAGMKMVKVLDFGISKTVLSGSVFGARLPLVQTTGSLVGTPCYMSPEQVRGDADDARSDVWSLGVTLYELLTGVLPFNGASVTEICSAILEKVPPSLRSLRADLPAGLADVVETCLAKSVEERYPNVADLAVALMPFAPRRARSCAERAAQTLAAAGLIEPTAVRFPSEGPPVSEWAVSPTHSDRRLRLSALRDGITLDAERPVAAASAFSTMTTAPAPPYTSDPPPEGEPATTHRRSRIPFVVGGVAIAIALGVLALSEATTSRVASATAAAPLATGAPKSLSTPAVPASSPSSFATMVAAPPRPEPPSNKRATVPNAPMLSRRSDAAERPAPSASAAPSTSSAASLAPAPPLSSSKTGRGDEPDLGY